MDAEVENAERDVEKENEREEEVERDDVDVSGGCVRERDKCGGARIAS